MKNTNKNKIKQLTPSKISPVSLKTYVYKVKIVTKTDIETNDDKKPHNNTI